MKVQSHHVDSCRAIESPEKIEVIKPIFWPWPSREDNSQASLQKTQNEEVSVEFTVDEEEMTNSTSVFLKQGEEDLISDNDSIPDIVEVNTQSLVDTGISEMISEVLTAADDLAEILREEIVDLEQTKISLEAPFSPSPPQDKKDSLSVEHEKSISVVDEIKDTEQNEVEDMEGNRADYWELLKAYNKAFKRNEELEKKSEELHDEIGELLNQNSHYLQENEYLSKVKEKAQKEVETAVCLYHHKLQKKNDELDTLRSVLKEREQQKVVEREEMQNWKNIVIKMNERNIQLEENITYCKREDVCKELEIFKKKVTDELEELVKKVKNVEERKERSPIKTKTKPTAKQEEPRISKDPITEQLEEVRKVRHESFTMKKNEKKDNQQSTSDLETSHSRGAWTKHNRGFADHYMKKCEYNGGGLGKHGDGIVEPIQATRKTVLGVTNENDDEGTKEDQEVEASKKIDPSKSPANDKSQHEWPRGTTLIVGDSMVGGVQESRLKSLKAKVRKFPGATISDMHDYLKPLLKKNPTNIILHVCTNDAPHSSSDKIVHDLKELMDSIMAALPSVKLFFSCPLMRRDNVLANSVVRQVTRRTKVLFNGAIEHTNIDNSCISLKGLHLNEKGTGRLSKNYISLMQRL